MQTRGRRSVIIATAASVVLAALMVGLRRDEPPFAHVPTTVSREWQAALGAMTDPSTAPALPAPDDVAGWRRFHDGLNEKSKAANDAALARFQPEVTERVVGGVPVLEITPKSWTDDGRLAIYVHGGGFTKFNARTTLNNSAFFASATGLRVLAIDYAVAPAAKWPHVTDQVVAVLRAEKEGGRDMKRVVLYGDSAGGALAAAATLKLRDAGGEMPGALVLWAPWSDLTETGDTYHTLKADDPKLVYSGSLKNCADAYADPKDQKHPYVSPVYGDYSKGFPPTLIQVGTKDLLLSCAVRQYQAIESAGGAATLDVYEGMPHVFQPTLPDSPESVQAMRQVVKFINATLAP